MEECVLLAIGDPSVGERWSKALEEAGYAVEWYSSGEDLLPAIDRDQPQSIVAVLMGTDVSDLGVGDFLRQMDNNSVFPLIAVLHEWNTDEVVSLFAEGANDVVGSSVPIKELLARTAHLIRLFKRLGDASSADLAFEDLRIELKSRKVYRDEELVKLTPKEFDLLVYLLKKAGEVCERDKILEEIWGIDFATGTNVVDVYIRHLRKKIDRGKTRKLIHTVRGKGYIIQ